MCNSISFFSSADYLYRGEKCNDCFIKIMDMKSSQIYS